MDNKTRGPTRDVIRAYYETNDITFKELSVKFDVPYNTIKSWRTRDKKDGRPWMHPNKKKSAPKEQKKGAEVQNRQQALSKAKAMVISGNTIEEAANQTGLNENTIKNHSSKEKWLESRKAYQNHLHKTLIQTEGKEHLHHRQEVLKMLRWINVNSFKKMQKEDITVEEVKIAKDLSEMFGKNMQTASKLLGIKDIDKVEFGELDDTTDTDDTNELIIRVIE